MDYHLISPKGTVGAVYQGGFPDQAGLDQIPGPIIILCIETAIYPQFVDHQRVHGVLYVGIGDAPECVVPTDVLLSFVDSAIVFLKRGFNLYVNCAAGLSRSSYFCAAVLMRLNHWDFAEALAHIRKNRPLANPNEGFVAHLVSLGRL